MQLIPYLNTQAGGILTNEDWRQVGIHRGLLEFSRLVMKPGIEVLKNLSKLHQLNNWHGELGLDITQLTVNASAIFTIISTLDGSKTRLDLAELLGLLNHLQPDFVLLTKNQSQQMEQQSVLLDEKIARIVDEDHAQADYLISDRIAQDAAEGNVYTGEITYSITDAQFQMDYGLLDENCLCPACSQQLTKAYFHHLYSQVPFLCQRFLIVHNVCNFQNHRC